MRPSNDRHVSKRDLRFHKEGHRCRNRAAPADPIPQRPFRIVAIRTDLPARWKRAQGAVIFCSVCPLAGTHWPLHLRRSSLPAALWDGSLSQPVSTRSRTGSTTRSAHPGWRRKWATSPGTSPIGPAPNRIFRQPPRAAQESSGQRQEPAEPVPGKRRLPSCGVRAVKEIACKCLVDDTGPEVFPDPDASPIFARHCGVGGLKESPVLSATMTADVLQVRLTRSNALAFILSTVL
jgi:hypothetical protein